MTEPDPSGYRFRDPQADDRFEHLADRCMRQAEQFAILAVGDLRERATFLCGIERLLLWVATEEHFVANLLDTLCEYILSTMEVLFTRFEFDAVFFEPRSLDSQLQGPIGA